MNGSISLKECRIDRSSDGNGTQLKGIAFITHFSAARFSKTASTDPTHMFRSSIIEKTTETRHDDRPPV
jgi:hypothetical protein